jgi:hypothetical protein
VRSIIWRYFCQSGSDLDKASAAFAPASADRFYRNADSIRYLQYRFVILFGGNGFA